MSSFTRRMQRAHTHSKIAINKDGEIGKVTNAGRPKAKLGTKLGHTDPKAADRVARLARELKRRKVA